MLVSALRASRWVGGAINLEPIGAENIEKARIFGVAREYIHTIYCILAQE